MEASAIKDGLASLGEYGMVLLIIFSFSFLIYESFSSNPAKNPVNQTLYLPDNMFPIKGFEVPIAGKIYNPNLGLNATFYGALQSNRTECVDKIAIYLVNDTTQNYSTELITEPKQVAKVYFNYSYFFESSTGSYIDVPSGYTLLCPNIINNSSNKTS